MFKYRNRIRRNELVSNIRHCITRMVNNTGEPKSQRYPFYKELFNNIRMGVDYQGVVRYYKTRNDSPYSISIEEELSDYHEHHLPKEYDINYIYDVVVDYIESKFKPYDDIVFIKGKDSFGEYFEVALS